MITWIEHSFHDSYGNQYDLYLNLLILIHQMNVSLIYLDASLVKSTQLLIFLHFFVSFYDTPSKEDDFQELFSLLMIT